MRGRESSAFGVLLRQYRETAALSQELLAERAGLSIRGVSDLERGARSTPRLETVAMLAEALNLSDADRAALLAARGAHANDHPSPSTWPDLPVPSTPLIGRIAEIDQIATVLQENSTRLVTLTGPGGVGKTRVALEAAHRIARELPGGVVFIDLSPVQEPELVLPAIASHLGIVPAPDRPLIDVLAVALKERSFLMVLDNLEQVIEAAPEVAILLARCPAMTILATSRAVLRIAAEQVIVLSPLALPNVTSITNVSDLARVDAVALFLDRAQAAHASFALTDDNREAVVELVTRLDGLPLAIELAAARIRILTPGALLPRLDRKLPLLTGGRRDAPIRQQTMRDAIAWSYELLTPVEQMIFRRISIFVAGCTLEMAESLIGVCDGLTSSTILDGLDALVANSLLRSTDDPHAGPRYLMLQTIREYGLEQLAEKGETGGVRDAAHRACYQPLALIGAGLMMNADQVEWLNRIAAEHENLHDHVSWLIAYERIADALEISGSLWFYLWIRGFYTEARDQWEEILAHPAAQDQSPARGQALTGLGIVSAHQGDTERSLEALREAVGIFRALADSRNLALALICLGTTHAYRGEFAEFHEAAGECITIAQEIGDDYLLESVQLNMGSVAAILGEWENAQRLFESAAKLARALEWPWGRALAEGNLGYMLISTGDLDRAEEHLLMSSSFTNALGSKRDQPVRLLSLAEIAQKRGDADRAASLIRESLQVSRDMGDGTMIARSLVSLAQASKSQPLIALDHIREAQDTFEHIGDLVSSASCFDVVADIALDLGDPEHAAWCIGVVDGAMARHHVPRQESHPGEHEERVAAITQALGEPVYRKHWARGHGQTTEAALVEGRSWEPGPRSISAVSASTPALSAGEIDILRLVAEGKTDREIVDDLRLTLEALSRQTNEVYAKLGVTTRVEAATVAVREGIV